MDQQTPASLSSVLEAIRHAASGETLSVGDILAEIGDRSFPTALLIAALILVSPISGIPGTPTVGAVIVLTIAIQWIVGRDHLWLPRFLMSRHIRVDRMKSALQWFDRPAAWIDRHSHARLTVLAEGPFTIFPLMTICVIAAMWPALELLPLVTSVGAFAVSLFAFGLMTRDGAYVLAGYVFLAVLILSARFIANGSGAA